MASSTSTHEKTLFSEPEPLVGKFISVLFQSNVRYEGICYSIDTQSNPSTITLAYVIDCGTEGRGTNRGGFEVRPKDYMVEHMIFLTNKIVRMKILAAPDWNILDKNNLSSEEYLRMLFHYATLNLMSPNSFYSINEYGPVIHPMASSNILTNQMAPAFGNQHLNANVQCRTSNGKSIIIEPPTEVKDMSIQMQDRTGNGNKASPMKKTEETVILPLFFGDFDGSVQAHVIISENERLQEVPSSDYNKIGKVLSSSRATEGDKFDSNQSISSDKERDKQEDRVEEELGADDHHPTPNLKLVDKGKGKMSYEDELAEKKAKKDALWKARIAEMDSLKLQPPKKR